VRAGESADPSRPVVRVVSTDMLRIEVNPPVEETGGLTVGGEAKVDFGSGASRELVTSRATISSIAAVADARSQTRLVRLSLKNPGNLPAGVQVRVEFVRVSAEGGTGP